MSSSYSENFWRDTQAALTHWQGLSQADKRATFASVTAPGFRLKSYPHLTPELVRVIGLIRRAQEWEQFSKSGGVQPQIEGALKSLTTNEERRLLATNSLAKPEVVFQEVVMKVESGAWAQAFMQTVLPDQLQPILRDWIARQESTYGASTHKLLQSTLHRVRSAGEKHSGIGFSIAADDLMQWVATQEDSNWASLAFWTVRLALLIPYVDSHMGLRFFYPEQDKKKAITEEVHLIRAVGSGKPGESGSITYHATPFLIDDIDAVLQALKLEPAPLLTDGMHTPMAYLRKLGKRLKTLGLLGGVPVEHGFLPEMRAALAWEFITQSQFFESKGRSWKNQKAEITPAGLHWLALSKELKWKKLLHALPFGRAKPRRYSDIFEFLGGFSLMPLPYDAVTGFVWQNLESAIQSIEHGVEFNPWLLSLMGSANPFTDEASRNPQLAYAWKRWQEPPGLGFKKLVLHYLAALASVGAVGFGQGAAGKACIQLTAIGRYVFGLSDELSLEEEWPRVALVGPDFTVNLMEPAPKVAEALREFTDLAKPSAKGGATATAVTKSGMTAHADAGVAFKITRESIQRSATKGLTFETVQDLLSAVAKNDLPSQVMKQIAEWFNKRSLIRYREGILIEGDDPLVMAELKSRFAKDFEMLSATTLLYTGKSKRSALLEKLAKAGYHLG